MPFSAFLAVFYGAWCFLAFGRGLWHDAVSHWPIALAMVFGSYFAGSTPVGGGSVAFPILTLLLDEPAALGRAFSFAIQSTGMTAAALYVIALRRRIDWAFLRRSAPAAALATPIALLFLTPRVPDMHVRLIFACLWAAFGIVALIRFVTRFGAAPLGESSAYRDRGSDTAAILCGVIGAAVASVIGGGADMIAFCFLVLIRRTDPRLAIPTGMMLMAATSLIGLVTMLGAGAMPESVLANWLAASPIVVIGAPLGALMVMLVPRRVTMGIVAVLCVGQFVWTCFHQSLSGAEVTAALAGILVVAVLLLALDRRSARRRDTVPPS